MEIGSRTRKPDFPAMQTVSLRLANTYSLSCQHHPLHSRRSPVMTRWFLIPAVALLNFALLPIDTEAQKKKKVTSQPPAEIHEPGRAVANLDVHPQLEATLFAHEDVLAEGAKRDIDTGGLTNPTNLDIDHRGR